MQSLTHATFSATLTALSLCTADLRLIGLGAIAGLLPDLDTPNSVVGRVLPPISAIISRGGHRQITHSLLGTAIAWIVFLPLLVLGPRWYWAAAIGYLSGWVLDAASKTGVPIFYPSLRRLVFPLDPEFRLKTGSLVERLLQTVMVLLLALVVQVNASGGAIASFSNWLGSSTGAVDAYHRYAHHHQVDVWITGVHRRTQEPLTQARMQVIGTVGEADLIVRDAEGHLYRAGSSVDAQIRASRVQVQVGDAIAVSVQPVEMPQAVPLSTLMAAMGDGSATGELTTDDAILLSAPTDPRYFQPISIQYTGSQQAILRLESATARDLEAFSQVWVQGSVIVRRVE